MARVYFVREEISVEVPVETSVLGGGDSGGACAGCALWGAGNLREMSGEGGWKAGAGVPDKGGKRLPGGDPWKEKKGEDFRRRFFQKGEFPAGAAGENGAAGEAGDWEKKVGVGAAAGGCL